MQIGRYTAKKQNIWRATLDNILGFEMRQLPQKFLFVQDFLLIFERGIWYNAVESFSDHFQVNSLSRSWCGSDKWSRIFETILHGNGENGK